MGELRGLKSTLPILEPDVVEAVLLYKTAIHDDWRAREDVKIVRQHRRAPTDAMVERAEAAGRVMDDAADALAALLLGEGKR